MVKKVAIILSGCGVFDGSEISETVLTFLALDKQGAVHQCFAPNIEQQHIINHLTGEQMISQTRNVLVESARIARGEIKDIKEAKAEDFDALILPGGSGAVKILSDFATKGIECTLQSEVLSFMQAMAQAKKPVGFICIAPAMIPKIYPPGTKVTIGSDAETAQAIEKMGAKHVACAVHDVVVDTMNKVVSTPAYMLAKNTHEVADGIDKLVQQVLMMVVEKK